MERKRICGECDGEHIVRTNRKNSLSIAWKDFPHLGITVDVELLTCTICKNYILGQGGTKLLDEAAEASARSQASQFIDVIKNKGGLATHEIATRLGVSPAHLSCIHTQKKTPSFQLWAGLRMAAKNPRLCIESSSLDVDIWDEDILLRA
jgi:hypothetical protein